MVGGGRPRVSIAAVVGSAWTNGWTATNNAWFVFNRTIDDVASYSYPLSGSRVKTHYAARSLGGFSGTKRVRVDYQDLTGNAALPVVQGPGSSTTVSAGVLSPRYGLVTSTVDPDGKKSASEYTNPELGLKSADIADPAGLNLRTVYTYEGASTANQQFRRQLTRSLPLTGVSVIDNGLRRHCWAMSVETQYSISCRLAWPRVHQPPRILEASVGSTTLYTHPGL